MTRPLSRHIWENKEERINGNVGSKGSQVYYGVIQALKGISFEVNQGR